MALRAAASDEDAMLGGAVGQALSLRGPRRPAITCVGMRLQRSVGAVFSQFREGA
jgi:hypothetical protein